MKLFRILLLTGILVVPGWGQLSKYQWHHLIPQGQSHYWRLVQVRSDGSVDPHAEKYGLIMTSEGHGLTYGRGGSGGVRTLWHCDFNQCMIAIMIARIMKSRVETNRASYVSNGSINWSNYTAEVQQLYLVDLPALQATRPAPRTRSAKPFTDIYLEACPDAGANGRISAAHYEELVRMSWMLCIVASQNYVRQHTGVGGAANAGGGRADMRYKGKRAGKPRPWSYLATKHKDRVGERLFTTGGRLDQAYFAGKAAPWVKEIFEAPAGEPLLSNGEKATYMFRSFFVPEYDNSAVWTGSNKHPDNQAVQNNGNWLNLFLGP